MTYEKEIPAYALQVARAPQIVQEAAVYHTEHITTPLEKQTISYQFEEDILVPDTKDDMAEILLMEADCDITPTEKKLLPKTDDLLNFTGTVTIQTLYQPEKEGCMPVAITSKVPYKYQWNLHCVSPAEGHFNCRVTDVEHMIINERKFRVKITLEFTGHLYAQQELSFFQSLENTPLEMRTKEVSFHCLEAMKKEEVQIEARLDGADLKEQPVQILRQHYTILENYRQVTTEKIVLNGFVYVELLYLARTEEQEESLLHKTERVEFTQFIPLEKEHRGKKWNLVKTEFRNRGLHTVIEKGENDKFGFRMEGNVEICVALYEKRTKEMVVDAYHLEKDFTCRFQKRDQKDVIFALTEEVPLRDLIHLPEGSCMTSAVCCLCRPVQWNVQLEKGRLILSGSLQTVSLWKDETSYHTIRSRHAFQQALEAETLTPSMLVELELSVRDSRLTLLNDRQMEFTCNLLVSSEGFQEKELTLLEEPGFVEGSYAPRRAMVISAVEPSETLWDLAKRHRTTRQCIQEVNHLEGEPKPGQKLLIIK